MELDKLVVKIEADLKSLKAGLQSANKQVSNSTKGMGKNFRNLGKEIDSIGKKVIQFGAIIGGAFGAYQIKKVVDVGRQIEDLQVRLKALFGTAEEGEKSFQVMLKYASKVPFTLEEIQQGAGNLAIVSKNAEELKEMLFLTGNVAAATGLDFRTTAEQMQRSFSSGVSAADLFRERGVTAMLGFQRGATVTIGETTKRFRENFGKGGKWGKVTDELAMTLTGTISMLQDKLFTFRKAISDEFTVELKKQLNDLNNHLGDTAQVMEELGRDIGRSLADALLFVRDNLQEIINTLKAFGIFLASAAGLAFLKFLFSTKGLVTSLITLVAMLGAEFFDAEKAIRESSKATKDFNDEVEKTNETIGIIIATEEQLKEISQELEKAFKDAGKEISDAFGDAVVKGTDFKNAMRDIFQSVISQIISTITHILIIQPMIEKLTKSLKGMQTAGDVTLGGIMSSIGSAVFGGFMAKGGPVMPNTPYVVGEKGAELFVPKQSGTIIPNNQLSGAGVTVNQTLNFSTGVVPTVRSEVMNLLPTIKEETINAVANTRSRGGSFARTFGA